KQPGSHLLSGAVVQPRALRELFRGRLTMADIPNYGQVPGEAVYVLTRRTSYRIPAPPTMRNHGNYILSASELGRFLGEQAEALGVKEVWRVRRPLRRIIHTMGWPLRAFGGYGEFSCSFIYPMGDELVSIGFVAGLEARDVELSVHDLLQEFKTHRLVWPM